MTPPPETHPDYPGRWMMTISFMLVVALCIQARYYIWRLEQRVEALEQLATNLLWATKENNK